MRRHPRPALLVAILFAASGFALLGRQILMDRAANEDRARGLRELEELQRRASAMAENLSAEGLRRMPDSAVILISVYASDVAARRVATRERLARERVLR